MVAEQKSPTLDGRQGVASGKSLIELEALAVDAAVWDPIGLSAFFNCISYRAHARRRAHRASPPISSPSGRDDGKRRNASAGSAWLTGTSSYAGGFLRVRGGTLEPPNVA